MGKKNAAGARLKGAEGFEAYYSALFGERWNALKAALGAAPVYASLNARDGLEPYFLDPASVFAAAQLPLEGAERVLDMCAAPGGKTLVLASRMDSDARLQSNERSAARRQRLVQVVGASLSLQVQERISVTGFDGARMCTVPQNAEAFDRILLDAPCSSERHVLSDPKYLAEWSPNRVKSLAMEQWALLSSAYRMLRSGGYLLYSTCALAPAENDEVIARLLKKFPGARLALAESEPALPADVQDSFALPVIPAPERTPCGFHILPDHSAACGPIWFSLIYKGD